tara:strand:+ start:250 stop:1335 length:1086 start_codon:yes stop_codon:yes gene_type:complete
MFKEKGEIRMSRELGNGRWDRVLKARMVELSEADNYDDAKEEWEATGNVWWGGINRDSNSYPAWVAKHPRECLCGHKIVYHYEIHNTKNGIRECVGSDHINSYLILKSISESTGIAIEFITDEMIEEWISVRVKGMKAEAWWAENGEVFTERFDSIKDMDLRVNVREVGTYYDYKYQMSRPKTQLRKKGKDGLMASIVWRWNHPDNDKAQINTRGYPNKQLIDDLNMFTVDMRRSISKYEAEDAKLEDRLVRIQILNDIRINFAKESNKERVLQMLDYYGLSNFYEFREGVDEWTKGFLINMEAKLGRGSELTQGQLTKLGEILTPATEKQLEYLLALGYEGTTPLSKRQATTEIDKIKRA